MLAYHGSIAAVLFCCWRKRKKRSPPVCCCCGQCRARWGALCEQVQDRGTEKNKGKQEAISALSLLCAGPVPNPQTVSTDAYYRSGVTYSRQGKSSLSTLGSLRRSKRSTALPNTALRNISAMKNPRKGILLGIPCPPC